MKILNEDPAAEGPQVDASPEILQKFEVEEKKAEEVVAPAPTAEVNKKAAPKIITKKISAQKKEKTPSAPVKANPELAKDYPPEYIQLSKNAAATWSKYQSHHRAGQKTYLDIHYLGMTVGKIMIANNGIKTIKGQEVWHFHSRFKSAPFYSSIYELDDTVDTYVTKDKFLSLRYSLVQRESKQNIDDLQLFDRELLKSFWFYKMVRPDKTRVKNEEQPIPTLSMDPFSVVFFFQGLPLKDGDKYDIPLMNKGKVLVLKVEVEGREKIDTELGEKKAVRLHAMTKYSGDHIKSGDMTFWFSDDDRKTLLKAQAKIKIGSVTADVVEIE